MTIQQLFLGGGGIKFRSDREYYTFYSLTIFGGKKEEGPFTVLISGNLVPRSPTARVRSGYEIKSVVDPDLQMRGARSSRP